MQPARRCTKVDAFGARKRAFRYWLAPAENAPGMRVFMNAITADPVLCIVIGAIATCAVHSSVATVLLIMSPAYAQFISLALVLGANLGSAINPVLKGARGVACAGDTVFAALTAIDGCAGRRSGEPCPRMGTLSIG